MPFSNLLLHKFVGGNHASHIRIFLSINNCMFSNHDLCFHVSKKVCPLPVFFCDHETYLYLSMTNKTYLWLWQHICIFLLLWQHTCIFLWLWQHTCIFLLLWEHAYLYFSVTMTAHVPVGSLSVYWNFVLTPASRALFSMIFPNSSLLMQPKNVVALGTPDNHCSQSRKISS